MTDQRERKKVLFLITKSDFGGAQRYVFDLATNLPSDQYETVVATGGNGPLIFKLREAGIKVVSLSGLQRDISLFKELLATKQIAKVVRDERPDILHINSSKAGGLGALIGRLLGVPRVIFTSHGWAFNEDRSWLVRFILKTLHWLTVLLAHRTIAVSHTLKQQLNWPFVASRMMVIHNGRQTPEFQSHEQARSVLAEQHQLLHDHKNDFWTMTIAELHPIKQHEVAIKAIRQLTDEGLAVRHLIIGDGELRDSLTALVQKLGLAEHVFLSGRIDEAARLLKATDIFILPSRSEALAYVVIEACQAGVPVIASRIGGLPEIITDGQEGFLVESGDEKQLATRLKQLLTSPELRTAMASRAEKRGADFTLAPMLYSTMNTYNE